MTADNLTIDKSFLLKRFLSIFLSLVLVLSLIHIFFYQFEKKQFISSIQSDEQIIVDVMKRYIESQLRSMEADLLFLANFNQLKDVADNPDNAAKKMLAEDLLKFTAEKKIFDQVRFIDRNGMEIVRINYNNGSPVIVPPAELQDKEKRYYQQDALLLAENQVYLSPLDLNIEHDKVEEPHKPMIRVCTPVFDRHGRKKGLLALNYLSNTLLHALDTLHAGSERHSNMLLNSDGYWLHYDQHPEMEFGFMFADKKGTTIHRIFPLVAERIWQQDAGQFSSARGIFTFATVYPMAESWKSSTGSGQSSSSTTETIVADRYFWKIINYIPANILESNISFLIKRHLFIFTLIILFVLVFSLLLSRSQEKILRDARRIRALAHHDHLTGLPNRAYFVELSGRAMASARRFGKPMAVLFIDLDRFKPVNDTLGHEAGDIVLRMVADRILVSIRESDIASRIGGDEFLVLLQFMETENDAALVARKIIDTIGQVISVNGSECTVGASIGISLYPRDGEDMDILQQKADMTMYRVKRSGRSDFAYYDGE